MTRPIRPAAGLAVVALSAMGGIAATVSHPAQAAALPTLTINATANSFTVSSSHTVTAGRVQVTLDAAKGKYFGVDYGIVQFKPGYTFADYRAAEKASKKHEQKGGVLDKKGRKGLKHVEKNVTWFGGAQARPGTTSTSTVVLPPGSYTLFNGSKRVSAGPTTITVTGPSGSTASPNVDAKVIAKGEDKFTGSKTLPADGIVEFANRSDDYHFVALLALKPGTTHHDVAAYLKSGDTKSPPFVVGEAPGTDVLSPGKSMTFSLDTAKGEYLETCFFNDTKTGMEHIYMGMYRIVHVK